MHAGLHVLTCIPELKQSAASLVFTWSLDFVIDEGCEIGDLGVGGSSPNFDANGRPSLGPDRIRLELNF